MRSTAVDRNRRFIRRAKGPVHALGIKRQYDLAIPIYRDETAIAADRGQAFENLASGHLKREATIIHACSYVICRYPTHEELAVSGTRNGTHIVGVGSGSDDRGVADPSKSFIGHSAGRRRGGKTSGGVAGDSADSTLRVRG